MGGLRGYVNGYVQVMVADAKSAGFRFFELVVKSPLFLAAAVNDTINVVAITLAGMKRMEHDVPKIAAAPAIALK